MGAVDARIQPPAPRGGITNPRYLQYARAHGRSGEEQLAHDKEAWPGGAMCGFILWMKQARGDAYARPETRCRGRIGGHLDDRVRCEACEAYSEFMNAYSKPLVGSEVAGG